MTSDERTAVMICYRREDAKDIAGRLADRLGDRIGENRVFMDVDAIKPGMNFADAINRALHSCTVLLVLIGPRWLTLTDGNGRRRLDDPDDLVVTEIRTALDRGALIIPVLVGGATMPSRSDLPAAVAELARRTAVRLDHETYRHDVVPLLEAVERAI